MKTSDFYYELPQSFIAQSPTIPRDSAKMLVYNTKTKQIEHKHFYDIIDYLSPNDCLVLNRSKVIPARMYCCREGKQETLEILLLKKETLSSYLCLVKPGKKFKIGTKVIFSDNLSAEVTQITTTGERVLNFTVNNGELLENEFEKIGEMPLPPYITQKLKDGNMYQTVYAKEQGSSAAPTAGLHFTQELLQKIKDKGVMVKEIVLHVGLGTFRPVKVEDVTKHTMHKEDYYIDPEVANELNNAKKQGKRIIAIGTTSVRTLETAVDENGELTKLSGTTDIFIYPPYKFKFVDSLVTNFHLPESTLLMLVSALMGTSEMFNAYEEAKLNNYKFFSFGDCIFII